MSEELKVLKVSKWKKLVVLHEIYHVRMLPCGAHLPELCGGAL